MSSVRVVVRFRPQQQRELVKGGAPICHFDSSGKNVTMNVSRLSAPLAPTRCCCRARQVMTWHWQRHGAPAIYRPGRQHGMRRHTSCCTLDAGPCVMLALASCLRVHTHRGLPTAPDVPPCANEGVIAPHVQPATSHTCGIAGCAAVLPSCSASGICLCCFPSFSFDRQECTS